MAKTALKFLTVAVVVALVIVSRSEALLPLPSVVAVVDGIGFSDDSGLLQSVCISNKCVVTRVLDENLRFKITFPAYFWPRGADCVSSGDKTSGALSLVPDSISAVGTRFEFKARAHGCVANEIAVEVEITNDEIRQDLSESVKHALRGWYICTHGTRVSWQCGNEPALSRGDLTVLYDKIDKWAAPTE